MSVFRTTNTTSDPYPISRSADPPVPEGPTERLAERRPRRLTFLLVLLTLLALNVAGVAIFFAWRAGALAKAAQRNTGTAGNFDVAYAREPLRVQVGCAAVMYLDLDEPRANSSEQVSDLRYDSRCGSQPPRLTLGPGATGGAQVQNSDLDAGGCARAIRTSPLGPGASVEVKKGAVLCVQTAGDPARMVLVEITEVGRTGTAGMRATSWKVTG